MAAMNYAIARGVRVSLSSVLATEIINSWSDNNEDKANNNYWVGYVYKEMGMIDDAIEYFENSLAKLSRTREWK